MFKLNKRILMLILLISIQICFHNNIYGLNYINEIGYNLSFFEINSGDSLNNFSLRLNNHTIKYWRIKKSNSNYYLFLKNNSKDRFNLSKIDCNLFLFTEKNFSSFIKNDNFTSNNDLKINLINISDKNDLNFQQIINRSFVFNIKENQSISFNQTTKKAYTTKIYLCRDFKRTDLISHKFNLNTSQTDILNQTKTNKPSFEINLNKDLSSDKIIFKIESNISKYTNGYHYLYWIEDPLGQIVKNPRNSTSFGKKSWTPKKTFYNIFTIKSVLFYEINNYTLNMTSTKKVVYINKKFNLNNRYSSIVNFIENLNLNKTNLVNHTKHSNNKDNADYNSSQTLTLINILNKKDFDGRRDLDKKIKFFISKVKNNKRVVRFILNNKTLYKVYLKNLQKFSGEINLEEIKNEFKCGYNSFKISGLDQTDLIDLYYNCSTTSKVIKKRNNQSSFSNKNNNLSKIELNPKDYNLSFSNKKFDILSAQQHGDKLSIFVQNKETKDYICYLRDEQNRRISQKINFTVHNIHQNVEKVTISLNKTILDKKITALFNLTIVCRYKSKNNYYYRKYKFLVKTAYNENNRNKSHINDSSENKQIKSLSKNTQFLIQNGKTYSSSNYHNDSRLKKITAIKKNLSIKKTAKLQNNSNKNFNYAAYLNNLENKTIFKGQIFTNKEYSIEIFLVTLIILCSVLLIKF